MKFLVARRASNRRGLSRLDVLVAATCTTLALAVALPAIGRTGIDSGEMRSLSNLRVLASAHEAYAQTFGGKQWGAMPEDAGLVGGSCSTYLSSIACPPQMLLGLGSSGAWWGYYLGEGFCSFLGFPGNCGNWAVYKPIEFYGISAGIGSFRLGNATSFNTFVDGRFYSDRFYSPNDQVAYDISAAYRDAGIQFDSVNSEVAYTSYCLSPAAMSHPDVFAASQGGFRDPNSFVAGYTSPTVSQCTYPDLKTRMVEHNWNVGAPGYSTAIATNDAPGFRFNASALASPNSLFFDGHVSRLANAQAMADDLAIQQTGGIGLWSRTTPFGANGYPSSNGGAMGPEGVTTSHTILTIDGILGRDLLSTR